MSSLSFPTAARTAALVVAVDRDADLAALEIANPQEARRRAVDSQLSADGLLSGVRLWPERPVPLRRRSRDRRPKARAR